MRVVMQYRNPTIVMQFVISNLLSPYLTEDNWWIHKWLMLPYLFWFTNSLVLFWYLISNGKICFFWSNLGRFLLLSLCLICMEFKFLLQFTITNYLFCSILGINFQSGWIIYCREVFFKKCNILPQLRGKLKTCCL